MGLIKEWLKRNRYTLIGVWFLCLQLIIIHQNLFILEYYSFWWFCDHSPFLLALGFFSQNKRIIKSIINFGFLVQYVWLIDFFIRILGGGTVFEFTNRLLSMGGGMYLFLPFIVHALSVNVAFFYTYNLKPTKRILFYSAAYILAIWILTIIFTPASENINCVQSFCGLEEYTPKGWIFMWPVIAFVLLILPTHLLQKWAYKKYRDKVDLKRLVRKPKTKDVIIEFNKNN